MADTFGGLESPFTDYGNARFAVLPVPYEKTTTWIRGTRNGPAAILEASANMELYDEELKTIPAEAGIATLEPLVFDGGPEDLVPKVKEKALPVLADGKLPVVLGGEHTVSAGFHEAIREHHGEVSVLCLDAHTDLRDSYDGSEYSHACVMKRIRELSSAVQAGVRSISEDEVDAVKECEDSIFHARDMLEKDMSSQIISGLGEKVHVSVDVDVFDPSAVPAVGTPEPGGLMWYDIVGLLEKVFDEREVVGFDLVELCPNEHSKASDYTVAKLAYKMMGLGGKGF